MPPRRGGRGRGMVRARPPAVIRESMQEIGMGSVATYEEIAKRAAAANADAIRAFYPALADDRKTAPMKLMANECNLVKLSMDICSTIGKSPQAVRRKKTNIISPLNSDLATLKKYYFANAKQDSDGSDEQESVWDLEKCWIIPDLLPTELKPPKLRQSQKDSQPKKKQRVGSDGNVNSILGDTAETEGNEQTDPQQAGEAREEDADDANADDTNAQGDVDDDLELDADYQTGIRFDDDDGYEEADSGAEEATF